MRNRLRQLITTLAIASAPVALSAQGMNPIAGDPLNTTSGKLAGTALGSGVNAYLGIPYAAPPVGDLRWAAPQPMKWNGVWNADRKGAECMQVLRPHDINHYFGEEASGENCLFMNIWTPAGAKPGAKLPVIVFIYGGGYTIGSSGMPNYGGEAVAKSGAIFVNFNYRVGALGFLAHPELSKEQGGHSGNYGTMDQTAALKWVHDNIAQFGGDPDKVVISGQSAGARSVATQIFTPEARGLFKAAMMSSGCNFRSATVGLSEAEQIGVKFQQRLGAADLAAMRNMPADKIVGAQAENQLGLSVSGVRVAGPIIDGKVLPKPLPEMMAEGNFAKVPIIASFNEDDMSFGFGALTKASTVAEYTAAANTMYGANAAEFLKLYPAKTDADVWKVARRAAQDAGFANNARGCAIDEAKAGVPTFIDLYSRKHPYVPGVKIADQNTATIGAYHTADIPYWFGTQDTYNSLRPTRNWTEWDRTLSKQMMGALIAMAETGSPNTAAMPWAQWSAKNETMLVLGDKVAPEKFNLAGQAWLAANPPKVAAPDPATGRPRD